MVEGGKYVKVLEHSFHYKTIERLAEYLRSVISILGYIHHYTQNVIVHTIILLITSSDKHQDKFIKSCGANVLCIIESVPFSQSYDFY